MNYMSTCCLKGMPSIPPLKKEPLKGALGKETSGSAFSSQFADKVQVFSCSQQMHEPLGFRVQGLGFKDKGLGFRD